MPGHMSSFCLSLRQQCPGECVVIAYYQRQWTFDQYDAGFLQMKG
jgi:hypothetical protein